MSPPGPSSLHSKLEPASLAANANVAVVELVPAPGPEEIEVSGACCRVVRSHTSRLQGSLDPALLVAGGLLKILRASGFDPRPLAFTQVPYLEDAWLHQSAK